ncbi:hypothetical protein HDU97_001320 [Phlyctochytrium planicorne]|nr:hypothetical protein HDU97_001320 [Phlyctochytrium planicorne]
MYQRLNGKTVLITGASSGIGMLRNDNHLNLLTNTTNKGKASALEFAKANVNLVLTARRVDRLEDLKKDVEALNANAKVHIVELDVTDRSKVSETIASLPSEFKDVHVLVNNAGVVQGVDTIENVTDEAYDLVFGTNVKGLLNVTRAVLPGMKVRNEGFIINVSSISGTQVYPGGGVYCASKHAVDALTRTLRLELVETGINVSSVDPGMVETEFSIVRFGGDKEKADRDLVVYAGLDPLTGQDIAETIAFIASRPPHVNVANVLIVPTFQAEVTKVYRRPCPGSEREKVEQQKRKEYLESLEKN